MDRAKTAPFMQTVEQERCDVPVPQMAKGLGWDKHEKEGLDFGRRRVIYL
jgi:hypothetical protein